MFGYILAYNWQWSPQGIVLPPGWTCTENIYRSRLHESNHFSLSLFWWLDDRVSHWSPVSLHNALWSFCHEHGVTPMGDMFGQWNVLHKAFRISVLKSSRLKVIIKSELNTKNKPWLTLLPCKHLVIELITFFQVWHLFMLHNLWQWITN